MSPTLRLSTPADLETHAAPRVAMFRDMETGSGLRLPERWKHPR